jgi:Phosphodiester glycosidase
VDEHLSKLSARRTRNRPRRLLAAVAATLLCVLAGTAAWYRWRYLGGSVLTHAAVDAPATLATWPWPNAARESLRPGVTHWLDRSSPDGTVLDLFEFDFGRNPRLEFSLFDQDQDDEHPFDDRAAFWQRGVAGVTRKLNDEGSGDVVAAANGLFFGYTGTGSGGVASHVAPVVVGGEPHFDQRPNPRWTFGVTLGQSGPRFRQVESAGKVDLQRYTFAAGGAQSLVRAGKLAPLPPGSVNKSIAFDQMRTTRVGLGWTRNDARLYLLFVKEPDAEAASIVASQQRISMAGGWSVYDVARFFAALGVWGAINSDGGDVGQLIYRTAQGRYELVPPKSASRQMRMTLAPDLSNAPPGGTLMYWVVRERPVPRAGGWADRGNERQVGP